MGEIIMRHVVERRPGYLYYVNSEGDIGVARLKRGGKKKNKLEEIQNDNIETTN